MEYFRIYIVLLILALAGSSCREKTVEKSTSTAPPALKVSENGHFLQTRDGDPFFWLGDTGWLLFTKLSREEAEAYLTNRQQKGFNVLQVSVVHTLDAVNYYGDSALINKSVARPLIKENKYDYWDNVDYLVDLAAKKGLYMALVPVWGNNVKHGGVSFEESKTYAKWLAEHFKNKTNIIWLNGGDTFGSDSTRIWNAIGEGLKSDGMKHLVTFHPRGRCSSSDWFHQSDWLNFNMVQSGHRRYDQDDTGRGYGQDNWRYIADDYKLTPAKPVIDGEPSYEGIPQGLHDVTQPFWNHNDVRRYAYWSVFSGAFGFSYGHSAVMQFYTRRDGEPAYGAKEYWDIAINSPGAAQMKYLKELMLSRSYFDRVPAQELLAENDGEKYDYQVATRGKDYAFVYTYMGDTIAINLDRMGTNKVKASWFCPRTGSVTEIGTFDGTGIQRFDAPVPFQEGNDWVLILDNN
jgi:hypothetical protein